MKKTLYLGIILLVVIAFGVYKLVAHQPSSDETVKVGALLCLTGKCAEWGENSLKGMQLAVKEINDHGGISGHHVEVVVQDSAEDEAKNAISGYQALREQGVEFIIGPSWTPAGLALYPRAKDDDVVMISPSLGVADFNEAGNNLFNTWPHDELATRYLARYAYNQGWRTVAILSSKQAWEQAQGNAFEDEFKKLGGRVVFKIEPHEDVRDFRTEAVKVKNLNPDVVMFANLTNMGTAAKDLKNLGYTGAKVSILMDDTRIEIAQGGLENTIYVQAPKSQTWFADSFKKEYGKEAGITADTAYDAMMLLSKGMRETGSMEPAAIAHTLRSYKDYAGGASGDFAFDGKGGVLKDPALWEVKGGKMLELR